MTVERSLARQYDTELWRIGVTEEARRLVFSYDGSLQELLAELRNIPTDSGDDGFFRHFTGDDFATWKLAFERQFTRADR